jgi:hypothetical protein
LGIDFLDIVFRLEKEFRFDARLQPAPWDDRPVPNLTAGQLHHWVCERLMYTGRPVPSDSWPRVQRCIGEALGMPESQILDIRPEDRLVQDLGAE